MKPTTRQIRMIWALSHQRGFDEMALRGWIQAVSGQQSIRALTVGEASRLIEALHDPAVERDTFRRRLAQQADRITTGQQWMIHELARQMGWNDRHLLGLTRHMYGRARRESLTRVQASGLIEALKAMHQRKAA